MGLTTEKRTEIREARIRPPDAVLESIREALHLEPGLDVVEAVRRLVGRVATLEAAGDSMAWMLENIDEDYGEDFPWAVKPLAAKWWEVAPIEECEGCVQEC